MLTRGASRDLFDAHHLLARQELDTDKLRIAFVVYGAMSRRDWRQVAVDDVRIDARELRNQLVPVLAADVVPAMADTDTWAQRLVDECRDALSMVLPFSDAEREFLDRLLDHGEICGDVLGLDSELSEAVQRHPALLWKAHHVRGR